jgi:hypothetical protein
MGWAVERKKDGWKLVLTCPHADWGLCISLCSSQPTDTDLGKRRETKGEKNAASRGATSQIDASCNQADRGEHSWQGVR